MEAIKSHDLSARGELRHFASTKSIAKCLLQLLKDSLPSSLVWRVEVQGMMEDLRIRLVYDKTYPVLRFSMGRLDRYIEDSFSHALWKSIQTDDLESVQEGIQELLLQ